MITRLDLDFVRRANFPWVASAFLFFSVLFFAKQAFVWFELNEKIKLDSARIEQLQRELKIKKRAAQAAIDAQHARMVERAKDEASVLKAIQYPWNQVLSTLEQASTPKVAVLSFYHDAATGDTKITAEAAEVASLAEFIAELNSGRQAGRDPIWYLASYQIQSQNVPATVLGTILQKR